MPRLRFASPRHGSRGLRKATHWATLRFALAPPLAPLRLHFVPPRSARGGLRPPPSGSRAEAKRKPSESRAKLFPQIQTINIINIFLCKTFYPQIFFSPQNFQKEFLKTSLKFIKEIKFKSLVILKFFFQFTIT